MSVQILRTHHKAVRVLRRRAPSAAPDRARTVDHAETQTMRTWRTQIDDIVEVHAAAWNEPEPAMTVARRT